MNVGWPWPSLTLHVELSPPAVILNEHGSAQESRATQGPNKSTEHEGKLQGPELGQEGNRPAPSEAVRNLSGQKSQRPRDGEP